MMRDPRKKLVETGYDHVAESYLADKDPDDPTAIAALEDLAGRIPPNAAILDLGCGAGIPATKWLAEKHSVVGVDVSEKQIELAKGNVPNAKFIKSDMASLDFEPGTFDASISFFSIIHVPREEHAEMFERVHRWLKPGGLFLATHSVGEWEGEDENWAGWGAAMWWSHFDGNENLKMLREAGFEIVSSDTNSGKGVGEEEEAWLWILARKP